MPTGLSRDEKLQALNNTWMPDPNYLFPRSGPRNLRFKFHWFSKRPWLKYSAIEDGAFCLHCALFAANAEVGKGRHVRTGQLVNEKLSDWKDALEVFNKHEGREYHKEAQLAAADWEAIETGKRDSIAAKIDSALQREVIQHIRSLFADVLWFTIKHNFIYFEISRRLMKTERELNQSLRQFYSVDAKACH